ncbi:hypothetical protein WS86_20345 [Burkholderia savannae]|uniref:hypothetical protein n=1 Tax=Burkholderia savannae TaxID=1637837 RepID=UPI0007596B96|nr:hypothetical protein [Burkholderia savannae]AOJ83067.1 hypothetical protein WS86_20345 [Burkholderia savannae]
MPGDRTHRAFMPVRKPVAHGDVAIASGIGHRASGIEHRASSVGRRTSDVGGHDMRSNVGSHRCCTRADSGYGIGRRMHTCRLRRCVCSAGVDGVAIGVAIVTGAGLEFDRLAAVTRLAVANAARDATPRRPDHALLDTGRTHAPRRRATPTT